MSMAASYIKIIKSYVNFTNILIGTYECPRMAASISWPLLMFRCSLDAVDVVPSTRKVKMHGSEFKFFVSIFRKLEEIII